MFAYNLHHVAIAVHDLDAAIESHRAQYSIDASRREVVSSQGVEEAMLSIGGSSVQLLMPLSPDSPVGRFLEKRGEGLHHIAYAVTNIEESLAHLAATGVRLIDTVPRVGGGGHRIAFVHPASFGGTLIELVEVHQ